MPGCSPGLSPHAARQGGGRRIIGRMERKPALRQWVPACPRSCFIPAALLLDQGGYAMARRKWADFSCPAIRPVQWRTCARRTLQSSPWPKVWTIACPPPHRLKEEEADDEKPEHRSDRKSDV